MIETGPFEAWADDGKRHLPVAQEPARELPPDAAKITIADLLARDDLPPEVRAWLEQAAEDRDWARANNPPGFVTDEGCWEKAKRAAGHAGADDVYAFATWFYMENCG
jgi:hypothetical protein